MTLVKNFWHGFFHMGTTFMYLQYSRLPLFITFCQMFGRCCTPSAHPSLLMFCIDHPIAWISSSLVLYRVPRSGSFTCKEIAIVWLISGDGWIRWMFQNLPLSAAQEVRDSSSRVTPCIVMKNVGVLYHQVLSFSPKSMRLCSLRPNERTAGRDPIAYKTSDELIRAKGLLIRNINKMDTLMVYDAFQTFGKMW